MLINIIQHRFNFKLTAIINYYTIHKSKYVLFVLTWAELYIFVIFYIYYDKLEQFLILS